jgi:hypothetical protein
VSTFNNQNVSSSPFGLSKYRMRTSS